MGKIVLKLSVLILLCGILFSVYLYVNDIGIEEVPTALSQTLSSDDEKYTIYEYEITKKDGTEYYGVDKNGTKIIFNEEKLSGNDSVTKGDHVKAYFSKSNRIDGLIKIVKVNK
ncbi:hypothetical protein ABES25_10765 [Bacillus gobiensis]|uniref:hypothetical protein n=1 Tax=Bacillus gobiensis TaxID=1441095 RepID=UPI003D1AE066